MSKMKIDSCNFPHETPVLLFFKGDQRVKKNYFQIKDIDECSGCLTLLELKECPLCCDEFVLVPTNNCILIDINCICAFQPLPKACIRNCTHTFEFKDLICGSFAIMPGYQESVIWQSNMTGHQFGVLTIETKDHKEGGCELRLYSKNSNEFKSYPIQNQQPFEMNLTDCSSITIFNPNFNHKVSGEFEICLQNEIDVNRLSYD